MDRLESGIENLHTRTRARVRAIPHKRLNFKRLNFFDSFEIYGGKNKRS